MIFHVKSSAHAVRSSSLRNISLRHNKITANGAVALALMIKDYPDAMVGGSIGQGGRDEEDAFGTLFSRSSEIKLVFLMGFLQI